MSEGKRPSPGLLTWRALRLRCPNCGQRGIFRRWLRMVPSCPRCGLAFERGEQGYIVGAYMLNIVGAELIFLAGFLGTLVATWPTPPWALLQWVAPFLVLLVPVATYPFSKTLFLAMDLSFRPVTALQDEGNRQ